jgi:hypothetical protein
MCGFIIHNVAFGRFSLWHLAIFCCGIWPIFVVALGEMLRKVMKSGGQHFNV